MRKHLRKYLPGHEAISANRWLKPFQSTLLHPRLWHLNRHSAAGAVATGLFCGLIPGPFQMIGAAASAIVFKVNLPLALLVTLYTNPLTIVPLYVAAFALGSSFLVVLGAEPAGHRFVTPPEYGDQGLLSWILSLLDWMAQLGTPLAVGLFLLAALLAVVGYFATRFVWRLHLLHQWRQRAARRNVVKDTK
ncbi:MAG: DUF2062 domain-containing protein [Gammaproteobacteria bacterium]|nr:DUF2062 domain-containing protein [Gammaproteobacteria bacterium]MBU1415532.1 DUF2062 domain-containing protein [Gammaproteobacteria bacterium]